MKRTLLEQIPTASKDALLEWLEVRLAACQQERREASAAFVITLDEKQRASALSAAGAQGAFEEIYYLLKGTDKHG
nr:MAG TPA: hypothetical protein [Caudoviricetes sp.]